MKKDAMASTGAVVSALASSACCWLPLVFVAVGISGIGVAALFAKFRALFLTLSVGLLALGFYFNYRRDAACAPDGSCIPSGSRARTMSRAMLWLSAAFVVAFAFFPGSVGRLHARLDPVAATAFSGERGVGPTRTMSVVGMTCSGCEASIELALLAVPGVAAAEADFAMGNVAVTLNAAEPASEPALAQAIERAGYLTGAAEDSVVVARLTGEWAARFAVGDGETVDVVIDLQRLPARWAGEFDVLAFGAENYPVAVEYAPPSVSLHFTGMDADFTGTLSPEGDAIRGIATTSEGEHELAFQRVGAAQLSEMFRQLEAAADDSTRVRYLSSDGAELRERFNAASEHVRLILLLSPT